MAVGEDEDQLVLGLPAGLGTLGDPLVGPLQEGAQGVEQGGGASGLIDGGRQRRNLGDAAAVDHHLVGILAVEQDDRHPGLPRLGLLLLQELVEPADHVAGQVAHGTGAVQ